MKKILLFAVFISMLVPVFSLGQKVIKPILYTNPPRCPPCRILEAQLNQRVPNWRQYIQIESSFSPSGSIPYLQDESGGGISSVSAIARFITNYVQQEKQREEIDRLKPKSIPQKQEGEIDRLKPKSIPPPPIAVQTSVGKGFYAFCTFIEREVTDAKTNITYPGLYKCEYLDNNEVIRSFTAYHIDTLSALGRVNQDFILIYKPSSGDMEYTELFNDDLASSELRKKVKVLGRELSEEKNRLKLVGEIETARLGDRIHDMQRLQNELTAMPSTAAQKRIIEELLAEEKAKKAKRKPRPVLPRDSQFPSPRQQTPTMPSYPIRSAEEQMQREPVGENQPHPIHPGEFVPPQLPPRYYPQRPSPRYYPQQPSWYPPPFNRPDVSPWGNW